MSADVSRVYILAAAAFTGVALLGSLFPFDFHAVPLTHALTLFSDAGRLDPARVSVTDAVSNFLLFVPIGLFATGALERTRPGRSGAVLVIVAATLVSAVLEFGQAFVSWRTPSSLDVVAEAAGATAGLVLWRTTATRLDALAETAVTLWRRSTIGERALLAYGAVFAVAWLLPFDFTLRVGEIGDKYAHKRLLLPFMPSPDAATPGQLRAILVAAIPLGLAGAVCWSTPGCRRSPARATLIATLWLLAIGFAQVPVFSRTTDTTLLVAALPGLALGAAAARITGRPVRVWR